MANKRMNFQTWLGKDKNLKLDFLDHELKLNRLITLNFQKVYNGAVIENLITEVQLNSDITELSRIDDFQNMGPVSVQLSKQTFDELKKNFRIFKFNHKNAKNNRVKKQFYLDQNLLSQLEKMTKDFQLATLENCLYNLVHNNQFNLKEELRKNKQLNEEIRKLQSELSQAQKEIKNYQQKTGLEEKNFCTVVKKFKDYIGDNFFDLLHIELSHLLKNELEPEIYEWIETIDLNKLIFNKLKPLIISKLELYASLLDNQIESSENSL
ncbi:hypothetical protein ACT4U4_02740 [Acinetobacter baumannii]